MIKSTNDPHFELLCQSVFPEQRLGHLQKMMGDQNRQIRYQVISIGTHETPPRKTLKRAVSLECVAGPPRAVEVQER